MTYMRKKRLLLMCLLSETRILAPPRLDIAESALLDAPNGLAFLFPPVGIFGLSSPPVRSDPAKSMKLI